MTRNARLVWLIGLLIAGAAHGGPSAVLRSVTRLRFP